MRRPLIVLSMLLGLALPATAQVSLSLNLALPGVSIGVDVPSYPDLVRVPGYPVYYAPQLQSNFFFYDGMYWVYQNDNWYASDWYDGPWGSVSPQAVPLYVLRIPVRYYRNPPNHFRGWGRDAPPRWGEHWGPSWQQQRAGWDRWNRRAAPAPAPLPVYQRQYRQEHYPQAERQRELRSQNYRYQPRDAVVRQHFREQPVRQMAPVQVRPPPAPMRERERERERDARREPPRQEAAPARREPPRQEAPGRRDGDRDRGHDRGDRGDRGRDDDDDRGKGRGPDHKK